VEKLAVQGDAGTEVGLQRRFSLQSSQCVQCKTPKLLHYAGYISVKRQRQAKVQGGEEDKQQAALWLGNLQTGCFVTCLYMSA
jgi:hypothetical protein